MTEAPICGMPALSRTNPAMLPLSLSSVADRAGMPDRARMARAAAKCVLLAVICKRNTALPRTRVRHLLCYRKRRGRGQHLVSNLVGDLQPQRILPGLKAIQRQQFLHGDLLRRSAG